jgi:hypothetical protein
MVWDEGAATRGRWWFGDMGDGARSTVGRVFELGAIDGVMVIGLA